MVSTVVWFVFNPVLSVLYVTGPLADIFNISVQKNVFPSKLIVTVAKNIPVYKSDDEMEPSDS